MKRLEGEVLDLLEQLGDSQGRLETEGLSVDPHQFLGLELNPRAAAIAELVLWIGYLQWHFRTRGTALPPSPILKDFHNIECRDAVLAHDGVNYVMDATGLPVSRWDERSFKPHPVTGEAVPDERAQTPLERYLNPRRADWPEADYVVGNPPFIGAATLRAALGDGYVAALRGVWKDVPESADFVMLWWHHAADLARSGRIRRFGFITTNSIRQTFNRRVLESALDGGLTLLFAIPDHPWVDEALGAAVRIAMTVAAAGQGGSGRLLSVTSEIGNDGGNDGGNGGEGLDVQLAEKTGVIHADLSIGADVAGAGALKANAGVSSPGFKLHGAGFIVTPEQAEALRSAGASPASFNPAGETPALQNPLIRPYRNGRDLTDKPRGVLVIDAFGLTETELRQRHPAIWQWLYERVKPERDHNARATYRENWWLFGEPRRDLRAMLAGLPRYIATVETAKHRTFQFLDAAIAPDNKLICIASDDAYTLGVLSSRVHVVWALAAGGTLEDRPRYNKTRCFDPFPFPDATSEQQARIRALAEELDTHRKRRQAEHPELTLTGMYNVLQALRAGRPLTAKEKAIHEQGLVALLKQLHDDLDAAVLDAYGWQDSPDAETLLERLAALNNQRAHEEAGGHIRWLRPAFQNPDAQPVGAGLPAIGLPAMDTPQIAGKPAPTTATARPPWPATLPEQVAAVAAVAAVLQSAATPLNEAEIATRFSGKGAWKKRLLPLLETLVALGRARRVGEGYLPE